MEPASIESGAQEILFDVPAEHIVRSSSGKGWHGIDIAEILHPLDDFALPAIPRHVLVINLGSPTQVKERLLERQARLATGNLVILPADAPTAWHLEREGEVRHLHLYLSPALLRDVAASADINPDTVKLIDAIGIADSQIEMMALSLFSELRSDGLGGKIAVESLTNLLIVHLLRHHSSIKQTSLPRPGSLEQSTLKRVMTFIEDHLTEDIALADLASVAYLSPYHFARRFKESTGFSPHQYVIRRRIERAKMLLSGTNGSLTTIAHTVGFASESHMALHFKRLTGLLPRYYR